MENQQRNERRQQRIVEAESEVFRQRTKCEILDRPVLSNAEAANDVQRNGCEQQPAHCLFQKQVDSNIALTERRVG